MKAIVLHAYGSADNLRFEDAPDPAAKSGELLLRVRATSVNPVDWMLRSGIIRGLMPIPFPYILGIDVVGTVEAVGDGVTGFAVGDLVMAVAGHAYAELCAVEAKLVTRVPEGLDVATAAALPLVTLAGHELAVRGAKAAQGQTVLVTGALGGVGRSAVFAAIEKGATVIAGVRGRRLDEARKLPGISAAVALDDDAALAALPPLDAVADAVGHEVAARTLGKVKPGGCFGCFPGAREAVRGQTHLQVTEIIGQPDAVLTRHYAEAARAGRLSIPITRELPLRDAAEGHRLAEAGAAGKIVLRVG
jgi:NADPH:quinone reductase-like Zn-dependent oxidoreductase